MRLKILNLTSTRYGLGGVENLLLAAADKYDPARFSVAYCNLFCDHDGHGRFPSALRARRLPYFHIPGRRWSEIPAMITKLVRLLRREQFQVVHTHMLQATIVGQLAAQIAGVPMRLVTRHYTPDVYARKQPLMRWLDHHLARKATHVIAVSGAVRDGLVEQGRVPPERVSVIHNGIDLQAFDADRTDPPLSWGTPGEPGVWLGCVGSLFHRKGHADLLRALVKVIEVQPQTRLMLVGEGPEQARLEALARELGIADHVLFAGFQSQIPALVRRFDYYVHPSLHEPFGIAILEAMAAGKAVIGTNTGGIPELVIHGETGLLVPPSDPVALAAAILHLVSNPATAQPMGARGRQRVERYFNIRVTVDKYQELYHRLTGMGCAPDVPAGILTV